jgi:hypothetical protein
MEMVIPFNSYSATESSGEPAWIQSFSNLTNNFYSSLDTSLQDIRENIVEGTFFNKLKKDPVSKKTFSNFSKGMKEWLKWFKEEKELEKERKKDRELFLKSLWGHLKGMGKAMGQMLKSMYGGWFSSLLKLLFVLAIFDPKGKFLKSILGFITKVVLQIVDFLLPYLPIIVKRMAYLITEVLPGALTKVFEILFAWVHSKLQQLIAETNNPTIKWILTQLAYLFSADGPLIGFLGELSKFLVPMFIGLGILVKLWPVFSMIFKIISILGKGFSFLAWVWGIITKIFMAIKTIILFVAWFFTIPAWVVALIVAAAVAIGVLIWYYWDEIVAGIGWMWKQIKKIFKKMGRGLTTFFTEMIPKFFTEVIPSIFNWLFSKARSIIKYIMNFVNEIFSPIIKGIKNMFAPVFDFFAMISDLSWGQLGSEEKRETFMEVKKATREKGIDLGKIEKAVEGDKNIVLNKAEKDFMRASGMQKGTGDYSGKFREFIDKKDAVKTVRIIKGVEINEDK